MMREVLTGNAAAAYGARLCRAEVVSAYPITHEFSGGQRQRFGIARALAVEPDLIVSASLVGARTFTATSSQGLLLMHEMLHWASGSRVPVVMVNINRAVAPPWSVWSDQTDTIAQRDTGWMQFYCESCQEVVDTMIQAYRVSEHADIRLPAILSEDAFILSHTAEPVDIPSQEDVDAYLSPYEPEQTLDVKDPKSFGSLSMPHEWYYEFRYKIAEAMDTARDEIINADKDFEKMFGRSYGGLVDTYRCDDASIVIIAAGSMSSTIRVAVDELRGKGIAIGLARLRVFRPFPTNEICDVLRGVEKVCVFDRSYSFGAEGPFFSEVKAALFGNDEIPKAYSYIIGLGGRDITLDAIHEALEDAISRDDVTAVRWIGLKGG